jgi:hypothetical protein
MPEIPQGLDECREIGMPIGARWMEGSHSRQFPLPLRLCAARRGEDSDGEAAGEGTAVHGRSMRLGIGAVNGAREISSRAAGASAKIGAGVGDPAGTTRWNGVAHCTLTREQL